jgi:hypothetical protein
LEVPDVVKLEPAGGGRGLAEFIHELSDNFSNLRSRKTNFVGDLLLGVEAGKFFRTWKSWAGFTNASRASECGQMVGPGDLNPRLNILRKIFGG